MRSGAARWPLWILSFALALLFCLSSRVRAADDESTVDEHALYDPITVSVLSRGVGASFFNETDGFNYLAQYRAGILSLLADEGGMAVDDDHMPLDQMTRTTTPEGTPAEEEQTVWQWTFVFRGTAPQTYPGEMYATFEQYCDRQADGECIDHGYLEGAAEVDPDTRKWLAYTTSVNLVCCDLVLARKLGDCVVCGAWNRNHLALILGIVLGFVGLVALVVAWMVWRRKGKARRLAARNPSHGVTDAGHKAPPANIGPAFDVHKHSSAHAKPQAFAVSQRPDHVAHQPPLPTVVVKVHETHGHHHGKAKRHEEPDADSSPIVDDKDDRERGRHGHKHGHHKH